MMEFFLTMPISSSSPIMLKMFSDCPAKSRAKAAPAIDSGRMVMIVTGSLNELNCDPRIM